MPMTRDIQHASPKQKDFHQRKQRAVLRCAFVASAEVTELDSGSSTKLSVRTSELGLGGCYIDTLNPFPEGTPVRLRILRDGGAFATTAKVVYTHQGFGMGLAFIEITPSQRSVLENWLAELVTNLKPAS
jgi:PilZ domain